MDLQHLDQGLYSSLFLSDLKMKNYHYYNSFVLFLHLLFGENVH